jgi:gliding motility-associated-like protein
VVGTGATLTVSTPGTYHLIGLDPGNQCEGYASVNVSADLALPVADAGQPFGLDCSGETAALDGSGSTGAGNLAFAWTSPDGHFVSGTTGPTPQIDAPGTYLLQVTNTANGCTDTDEVAIATEAPVAYASVEQPVCGGGKGTIRIDSVIGAEGPFFYRLGNGPPIPENLFTQLSPGTYTILVEGAMGCDATVEATVEEPETVQITLEPEADLLLGYSYQVDAQLNLSPAEVASMVWTPAEGLSCDSCLNPVATPLVNTQYQLTVVSLNGCEARATLTVLVDKDAAVYVPNAFAPTSSQQNDLFRIFADEKSVVRIKSFQVFSRWGELVHEYYDFDPADPAHGWDGKLRGKELNPDVFVWQAVVVLVDGREVLHKGDVTLSR